jgi:cyclophilin family peptidyl-prolyl cis-trans isomerase
VPVRSGPRITSRPRPRRLELESLEERAVPTAATLGTISAFSFIDVNRDGHFDTGDRLLPFVPATLSGTTTGGAKVSETFTSNANGTVIFPEVAAGTYQVQFGPLPGYTGSGLVSGIKLAAGQSTTVSAAFLGLASTSINLGQFTTNSTSADFRFTAPIVSQAGGSTTLTSGSTTVDLAANFAIPGTTNSLIRMDTSAGPMFLELFDGQVPRTIANFYNYIHNKAYANSIFHRLVTASAGQGFAIIQGGGFSFVPALSLTVTAAKETGTTVTLTTTATGLATGDTITVSGFTPSGYNGTFKVTGVTGNQVTYTATASGLPAATVFGTAVKAYAVTKATESGTTVTLTTASTTGLNTGDTITVSGFTPAGYNGTFTITNVTGTTITYTATASGLADATVLGKARKSYATTAASETGTTVTMTSADAGKLKAGDKVTIAGFSPSGYNGTFTVKSATKTSFTFTASTSGLGDATAIGTVTRPATLPSIKTDPTIKNEYKIPNTAGTIAMARQSGADTASDQFFFNLENNSSVFGPSNTGGYVVFGKVLNAADMTVLNTLAAATVTDESNGNTSSAFNTVPLNGGYPANSANFPGDLTANNVELVKDVAVINRGNSLTYTVVANSDPAAVKVSIVNERMTVTRLSPGTATCTIKATDRLGQSVTTTFTYL